jgi:hypothetical protein
VASAHHNVSTNQTFPETGCDTADNSQNYALEDPSTLDAVEVDEKAGYGAQVSSHGSDCHRSDELVLRYMHLVAFAKNAIRK